MKLINLASINGTAAYQTWAQYYLKPIDKQIRLFHSYIDYFLTPYIKDEAKPAQPKSMYTSYWTLGSIPFRTRGSHPFYVRTDHSISKISDLSALKFHHYFINTTTDVQFYIGPNDPLYQGIIGYYISNNRPGVIDSHHTRQIFGTFKDYTILRFSDGSYYTFDSYWDDEITTDATTGTHIMKLIYKKGSVEKLGGTNFFNLAYWPQRYTYEHIFDKVGGYIITNQLPNAESPILIVKTQDNIVWASSTQSIMHEIQFKPSNKGNDYYEEFISDTLWTIKASKLEDQTILSYNITSKNGNYYKNTVVEVY